MVVTLRDQEEIETWLTGSTEEATKLQRQLLMVCLRWLLEA